MGKRSARKETFIRDMYLLKQLWLVKYPSAEEYTHVIGFLGQKGSDEPTPLRLSEVNRILGKVDELLP